MSSRRYIKRIWRVPQTRGPVEYLATALCKALRKHGWPASFVLPEQGEWHDDWSFQIEHNDLGIAMPPDFLEAVEIATRIIARAYRVDVSEYRGFVTFNRPYTVAAGGHFKEVKP